MPSCWIDRIDPQRPSRHSRHSRATHRPLAGSATAHVRLRPSGCRFARSSEVKYREMTNKAKTRPSRRPLTGRVAVVAGATRGAGRGIARALGEAGAMVYCTGRSITGKPSPYARPETIDETAGMIKAAGGTAKALRVDHTNEKEVRALFRRVL